MAFDVKKLSDIDYFFFYSKNNFEDECAHDLYELLLQPQKSIFYNREFGAGVSESENSPNALSLQVNLRYQIAQAIADRNSVVTDGRNGTKDRRIAASQFSINFKQAVQSGELDVEVFYFLYANYDTPQNLSMPVGTT